MIDSPELIYRTTDEWKRFLKWQSNIYNQNEHPPEYWYTDRFWNYILGKFNFGKPNKSVISYEDAKLVYEARAYFWRNPILQEWEVVELPEHQMLRFMDLV